jgi:aspartate-semialdehyde dehydrogenase
MRKEMVGKTWRGAVVGASTLLGKELAEELNGSTDVQWDITLLDADDAGGTITAAGDEALVIQSIARDSFIGIDVVFFAGQPSTTLQFWKAAHVAGASIVDLTGALEGQPDVQVRSPLVEGAVPPNLSTIAEVSAHPAAIMLALAATRLRPAGLQRLAATVLQPASELGNAGVEEVHQQTVGLLSFQPLKKDIYDAQVAFNIVASLGSAAKADLQKTRDIIHRHIGILAKNDAADSVTLQLLQAPVFHGYTASVFLEMSQQMNENAVLEMLVSNQSHLLSDESPSNDMAAGKGEVLVRVIAAEAKQGSAFWLWMATDNLRLSARNAVACALELIQQRPTTGVQ